ncbi:hypothetical protein F511_18719 [Dorcoceras hygrometricum]|uniref:Uncharacterized protein n=1 Tax=Dorcoceras hygrometricum TaxID=472368 RepID=A0A2Z7C1A3_9LAMI|nr:hypothetical protein F511_18719 [Dorcoceras hygrometricum]
MSTVHGWKQDALTATFKPRPITSGLAAHDNLLRPASFRLQTGMETSDLKRGIQPLHPSSKLTGRSPKIGEKLVGSWLQCPPRPDLASTMYSAQRTAQHANATSSRIQQLASQQIMALAQIMSTVTLDQLRAFRSAQTTKLTPSWTSRRDASTNNLRTQQISPTIAHSYYSSNRFQPRPVYALILSAKSVGIHVAKNKSTLSELVERKKSTGDTQSESKTTIGRASMRPTVPIQMMRAPKHKLILLEDSDSEDPKPFPKDIKVLALVIQTTMFRMKVQILSVPDDETLSLDAFYRNLRGKNPTLLGRHQEIS